MKVPSALVLDAIGCYVEQRDAVDVLVCALDDGFLVAYVDDDGQHLATFEPRALMSLLRVALRHSARADLSGPRARLRGVGRWLDRVDAHAFHIQESGDRVLVECTARSNLADHVSGLARFAHAFDTVQLLAEESDIFAALPPAPTLATRSESA